MPRAICVEFEVHGLDSRPGEWCDDCALPSVVEADFAIVIVRSMTTIARTTVTVCTECGRQTERPLA